MKPFISKSPSRRATDGGGSAIILAIFLAILATGVAVGGTTPVCDYSVTGAAPPKLGRGVQIGKSENTTNREYWALIPGGQFFHVKYSACAHVGMHATLAFPKAFIGASGTRLWHNDEIRERLLKLGTYVLDGRDFIRFRKVVDSVDEFEAMTRRDVSHEYYSEFYFTVETAGGLKVLSIVYWF